MQYDVIVIGAGPAGSTAARECADRGLSVLMLDKAEFPRDKPCGGGVTIRAAELLPFDLHPVTDRAIHGLHLSHKQSEGFIRQSPDEIVYLTQRRNFDAYLAEKAVASGVRFVEGAAVVQVERGQNKVVVHTGDQRYQGTILVAADGANGKTANLAGFKRNFYKGIALEGNITPAGNFPDEWSDTIGVNVGSTAGGYGWVFPKSDHLNIGIGGWMHIGPTIRQSLYRLVNYYGFDPGKMWGVKGYHLPIRKENSPLVDGNVVLVGDAGGLIDPLTGEGIYAGIWSGGVAAKHISAYLSGEESDVQGYQTDVERGLMPELLLSRQFQDVFNLTPGLYIALERRTAIIWKLTRRILRGEQTYTTVMGRHPTLAIVLDLVSDLIRVTPFLQRHTGLKDPLPPRRFFVGDHGQ